MKRIFSFLVAISFFMAVRAQQAPIRLLIRGDDMGYTHSGNEALIQSYKEGIERSVEVIVPSPWFTEAVKLLKQNPGIDVGVHLAITSEWENIKWRPLTACKSLTDSNGYFFPMVDPNPNYPGQSIKENKWTIGDIEKEFRAQIEMALKNIPNISHISTHMWCDHISDDVQAMTKKLAKEYHIDIDPSDYNAEYAGYDGPSKTSAEKIESFISRLKELEPGKTYWFLDHPGFDNEELRAVFHIGYENVAADRQGVTDLFTSEKVKAVIKERGIQLISYADLIKEKKK
jgi:chitin disaccharide deacetylase